MTSFFKRWRGDSAPPRLEATPHRAWQPDASAEDFVDLCFRLILGRIPKDFELGEHRRSLEAGTPQDEVRRAFIRSPEFLLRRRDWRVTLPPPAGPDPVLDELGSNEEFIDRCYHFLLDREPDQGGRDDLLNHLRSGHSRAWVVRTLATSKEFGDKFAGVSDTGAIPIDVQLCELANPAKWDNPDWLDILLSYVVIPDHKEAMHRKGYEFTQLAFGLKRLGFLRDDVRIVSVGAGHEAPAYWLANHVQAVVGTDLYEGEWTAVGALEGDAAVIARPEAFAPFPYRQDRLRFLKMNGCQLGFADRSFDVAYSLSSIEHFGGVEGARRAVGEMARVVRPGGIVAVATEWCVEGPGGEELFTPDQVRQIIDHPTLRLVQPIDERVWDRYKTEVVDVDETPLRMPHMLLRKGDCVFTSVMVFMTRVNDK